MNATQIVNSATALVLPFSAIDRHDLARVGGKGANLGEMSQAGLPVPPGFCVTTDAFRLFLAAEPDLEGTIYGPLARLAADDVAGVREAGGAIRRHLAELPVPPAVAAAVLAAWQALDPTAAYAVRSSATAEDLPGASFAGQQDTYLNVRGEAALLTALRNAWISLFTDRAILYRAQNGFDHREVALSAVVQQLVEPAVSGIMFTADPLSGNRELISIDAGFGLGEALVSGIISADLYRVEKGTGRITEQRIADKKLAIRSLPTGGTETIQLSPEQSVAPSLQTTQVAALAALGRRIEQHYGQPQDIEWVITPSEQLFVVQSRPITSLFPLPTPLPADDALHVYLSFGHAQVMTDPISPLGRSLLRNMLSFGAPQAEASWVKTAAGRIYIDASSLLHHRLLGRLVMRFLNVADPLIAAGISEVASRPAFKAGRAAFQPGRVGRTIGGVVLPIITGASRRLLFADPDSGVAGVAASCDEVVADVHAELNRLPPQAALARVPGLIGSLLPRLLRTMPPVMGSGYAAQMLLGKLAGGRATPGDLDAIARGLHGNATTEMDLAVGDLADVARRSPAVTARLQTGDPATAIAAIRQLPDSGEFLAAWDSFLAQYGMRGPSEIDIARARWREETGSLVQMVAGSLRGEAGAHREHHARMAAANEAAGERLVAAAGHGLFGGLKRRLAKRLLRLVRSGLPVREHPKFAIIRAFGEIKLLLGRVGAELAATGRLAQPDDLYWLDIDELIAAYAQPELELAELVAQRREAAASYGAMRPPRVLTSTGEIPEVRHQNGALPAGALPGISASAGVVEGRARVVLDPTTTVLTPGEILVAPFTDPGWTPL
ncbi:MAG: hypothetical protein KDE28_03185, partial [Anaerolineales bacterium]|nr:hypothetical protein [Anaerolineales bacterium]